MAINAQCLDGICFADVDAGPQIEAPAEDVLVAARRVTRADVAKQGAELHMTQTGLLVSSVETEVGRPHQ